MQTPKPYPQHPQTILLTLSESPNPIPSNNNLISMPAPSHQPPFQSHRHPHHHKSKCLTSISRSIIRLDNMNLTVDQSLEIMRISIRKEVERRGKLRRLYERYCGIYGVERRNLKDIKAAIIEMKDITTTTKPSLLIPPTLPTQNTLSPQTRQFLLTLLNTFHKTYAQNQKNSDNILALNSILAFLIKSISYNQDMIFMMQRSQINELVQLEGDLLSERNRIKEEAVRGKEVKAVWEEVGVAYRVARGNWQARKYVVGQLRDKYKALVYQSQQLQTQIQQQQCLKTQCKGKIDAQLLFQQKLSNELSILNSQLQQKNKMGKKLMKELFERKAGIWKENRSRNQSQNSVGSRVGRANTRTRKQGENVRGGDQDGIRRSCVKSKTKRDLDDNSNISKCRRMNKTIGQQAAQKLKFQLFTQFSNIHLR